MKSYEELTTEYLAGISAKCTAAIGTLRYAILVALRDYGGAGELALTLKGLSEYTGLPRETLRGIVADLRADGLTIYVRGLWGDDGQPAGAGYSITPKGMASIAVTKGGE